MTEPNANSDPNDEFDAIVERLDMDVPFPEIDEPRDEPEAATPLQPEPIESDGTYELVEFDDMPDSPDEQFYRQVPRANLLPEDPRMMLALVGLIGPPLVMVVASLTNLWLPEPVLLGLGLIFAAGAIGLIARIPRHGPGRRDWPDDGAVL